jgi:hypothetical protein
MPGFDGTGPRGEGPMTGRGEGYCALVLPSPEGRSALYGYAGLQGTPVYLGEPCALPRRQFIGRIGPVVRPGRAFRRGRRRGQDRWFAPW